MQQYLKTVGVIAVLTLFCSLQAGAYQYPADPQKATEEFLFLREQLDAQPEPAAAMLASQPASLAGQVLDLAGEIVGKTRTQREGEKSFSYLLQTLSGVTVLVQSTEELQRIRVGDDVRMLVEVPKAASNLAAFEFRGIVRIADLPAEERPQPQPSTDPAVTMATTDETPEVTPAIPEEQEASSPPSAAAAQQPYFPAPPPRPGSELGTDPGAPGQGEITVEDVVISLPASWMLQADIEIWKQWVGEHNPKLTDEQRELVVRWIIHYSRQYGLDHRLCFAVAEAESDFRPGCVSHAGAVGIMQLMPCAAEAAGVTDRWNVQENIRGGIQYFSERIHSFAGRSNYEQTCLGLAAYNAGPNAVKKYGGIPPYPETTRYVKKVTSRFYQLWKDGYP